VAEVVRVSQCPRETKYSAAPPLKRVASLISK
jgi:hypothetical protein